MAVGAIFARGEWEMVSPDSHIGSKETEMPQDRGCDCIAKDSS